MKYLLGGLVIASFISSCTINLVGQEPKLETKTGSLHAIFGQDVEPDRPKVIRIFNIRKTQVRSKTLEVVTMKQNCYWCNKFKDEVLPKLKKNGYEVKIVYREDDKRGTTSFPTLYYLGEKGEVNRKDVGFRNYVQIIPFMEKPEEKPKPWRPNPWWNKRESALLMWR